MLSKSFTASLFLLALTSSVNANAIITPCLGVQGTPGASDVQQPSDASPCGSIPIAQNLDTSSPIQADSSGEFKPSITNFDTGSNGPRSIATVKIDPSGTGSNFVAAQMVVNGDADPTNAGTQQLTVKLPDGINCVGGSSKDRCLASFITTAGSGNCVVVTQAGTTGSSGSTGSGAAQPNGVNGSQPGQSQTAEGNKPKQMKRMTMKRRL